ncbi:hypothetical protein RMSM_01167, partial [Rhodopirellula maiorica SM1]
MTNIKIQFTSYPGETTAWMYPVEPYEGFVFNESGYPLTKIGPDGEDSTDYWVTVPSADIQRGRVWMVKKGGPSGFLGSRSVFIKDDQDDYPTAGPTPASEDNGLYLITTTVKDEDGELIQGARVGIAGTSYSRVSKVGGSVT